jgi:ech hydrogenase subunit F
MKFFPIAGMIMRSLFGRPATLMYPLVPHEYVKDSRGHIEIAIADCIYCGLCQRKCPTAALTVDREEKTWAIDRLRCVSCNCCSDVCPKKCLTSISGYSAAVFATGEVEKFHA